MSEENKKNQVVVNETVKTSKKTKKENEEFEKSLSDDGLDPEVLKKLRSKKEKKENIEKDRSLYFGFVGLGQAGSRLAEIAYSLGYEACVFNTAEQDLEHIKLPNEKKVFLPFSLGGAGKDLSNGQEAVEQNAELIIKELNNNFNDENEMLFLCVSGGGGTGSGGSESIIGLMSTLNRPIGVIYILPMESEDALSKHNSVITLGKLASMASSDVITTLVVVDNAKIDLIYPNLSKAKFWDVANNAIIEPLHLFNVLSKKPSKYDSLDSMDFSRIITSGDCSIYGTIDVENYMETTAIAEAIIENLESGLLADEFDLKDTRFGGFIIVGNENVLSNLPAANINYASVMINDICDSPSLVSGVYEMPIEEDIIRIYTMFGGLGLPTKRVENLKKEAQEKMDILKNKEQSRSNKMEIEYNNKTTTQTKAQDVYQKIKKNKSAFGQITNNYKNKVVKDRRKR
jgi:cell division GTPase FtsZ